MICYEYLDYILNVMLGGFGKDGCYYFDKFGYND